MKQKSSRNNSDSKEIVYLADLAKSHSFWKFGFRKNLELLEKYLVHLISKSV